MKVFAGGVGILLLPLTLEPLILQIDGVFPPDDDDVQGWVQVRGSSDQAIDKVRLPLAGNVDESNPVRTMRVGIHFQPYRASI